MFTLHATKKLRDRLDLPIVDAPPPPSTVLGDWTANLVHLGRRQLVIAVSARTFLPVVVAAAPRDTLVDRLRDAVGDLLRALGIPSAEVEQKLHAMREVALAKASDRRVLGMVVEFAWLLEHEPSDLAPHDASLKLSEVPCGPLSKREVFPDRATRAAFGCGQG